MAVSDRERKLLIFGGGGLALFVLFWFIIPAILGGGGNGTTVDDIGKEKSDLEAIRKMIKDFDTTRDDYQKIERAINSQKNVSILAELEALADAANIKANIESMDTKSKPKNEFFKEDAVDIRLIKLTLDQLITFLYSVEYSPKVLRVKKMHLEVRYDNPDLINADIEISTFKPL